ncbi:MAG: 16S rRNA (cytosine(967)-C(5))-methyltransferase RsmB [Pseudomonadota bacterium]
MPTDSRAAAATAIAGVLEGRSLNHALPAQLARVAPRDRALLQQLCYGTLRSYPRLLAILEQLLDKPLKAKDADVQALMLLGLYQLEEMRIPDHASVSATVAAVKPLGKPWARGLTNAILRRFQRERQSLLAELPAAAAAAHPAWLYGQLRTHYPQQADAIMSANNEQPPMTLRCNLLLTTREEALAELAAAGVSAREGTEAAQAIYLHEAVDVAKLPGFAQGQLSVQDEAAQLAAILLDAQPGDRILDACAAPGGKTCHILELQPQLGELVAMDIDDERLKRVEENLERLGLRASLIAGDASKAADLPQGGNFDKILVDAPCSASGVIRRHPDIKLLRRPLDITRMAAGQLALLEALWPRLKPGGRLLYVTCSILPEENSEVVDAFLSAHDDARASELSSPGAVSGSGVQLLPTPEGPDGLFYARLEKAP